MYIMSNSSLVNYTKISPHSNNPRNNSIRKITIHHMAGDLSVQRCGDVFQTREASANYGIDSDGRVGMFVEERNRSWASSSPSNDNQAVTIEVANDGGAPNWHVSDTAINKLIDLCVDICQRNHIAKLNFTGNADGNLTMHRYFAQTTCPGPYLMSKFPMIAEKVNARLGGTSVSQSNVSKPASNGAPDIELCVNAGSWLPKVYGHLSNIGNTDTGCAGVKGRTIEAISLNLENANFKVMYAVHGLNGHYYPAVSSSNANINDNNNGYAGSIGTEIDGVRMWVEGSSEYDIQYQVILENGQVEPPVYGKNALSKDDNVNFAGCYGKRISFITAKLIKK